MKDNCIALRSLGFLLLAIMVLAGGPVFAEDATDTSTEPVALEAEELEFDQQAGVYQAMGDVLLRQGSQTLAAESLQFNEKTGEAQASGKVRLFDSEAVVTGDALSLNINKDTGSLRNGQIFLPKPNFHVAGSEIEKLGKYQYHIQDATFTTCDGEIPSWKFSARQLDVTVGGYAWAKHVFFHLYDVPVLYLPMMGYPVKVERESGLLMPRYGQSDKRGTELSLVYYQVIDRHMDATFYLDYFSKLGVGKGLEYRYFLGHDNEGEAKLYHVSGLDGHSDQVAVNWQHLGTLPGQVRLIADAQYVSSRRYFSEFGEVAGEYNRDRAETVVAASRHWGNNNLAGQFKYLRQLNPDDEPSVDDDLTLQRLPEVHFDMLRRRLGYSSFYYSFDSSGTYLWQKQGAKVGRLSLRPALSAQFTPGDWLEVGAEVGYRERVYSGTEGDEQKGVPDATLRLGTRLNRVYAVNGETVSKVQHILQPEVVYDYVPAVNQDDLPQFEADDLIGRRNTISYGLVNRLVARLESPQGQVDYREFLYLRVAQEYDLGLTQHIDLLAPDRQNEDRWSDFRTELTLRPTRHSYFDLDSRLATSGGGGLRTFSAEGGLEDGQGNALALRYRYRQDVQEYVAAKLDLAWLKPVFLSYEQRYAMDDSVTLENVLNLEYRAQCWSMYVSWRDRRDEQQFTVSFALTGIGKTDRPGSSLESTL